MQKQKVIQSKLIVAPAVTTPCAPTTLCAGCVHREEPEYKCEDLFPTGYDRGGRFVVTGCAGFVAVGMVEMGVGVGA